MFRRGNFTSICKNYRKYIDGIKKKLQAVSSRNKISSNVVRRYETIVDSVKEYKPNDILDKLNQFKLDTKCRVKFGRTPLQPDVTKKIQNLCKTIQTNKAILSAPEKYRQTMLVLQKKLDILSKKDKTNSEPTFRRANKRILFTGAGILGLNSTPVTISGYSSYDLEILRQLGIVDNTNINVQLDSTATNQLITENVGATNQQATLNSTDFPPSQFDMQNNYPYQSIFDNMPPEETRNDIYTTIYNTFNRPSSISDIQQQNSSQAFAENHQDSPKVLEEMYSNPSEFIEITGHNSESTNQHLIYTIDKDMTLTEITNIGGSTDKTKTIDISDSNNGKISEIVTNSTTESVTPTTTLNLNEMGDGATNINLDAIGDGFGAMNVISDHVKLNSVTEPIVEAIPEPPPVPDIAAELTSQINSLGEPTFASLGLGGWSPVGIVQNCFEYLHVTLGVPWWEAVVIGTIVIRFLMFPLVVIAQRNGAKMNNHLPQMQVIQMKMTEARQSGNQLEAARYSQELMTFMKEKNVNPLKNMIVPLAQMPVFVSFFVGLRQMANVPVESLRTGGLFWFQDLTVPDQFFALPVITSLTLWATIELGTDSAKLSSQNLQTMKYVLRALPLIILPLTVNFPGVILCYWVSSNFISLAQVGFLKIPAVRDYFKIDPLLKHDPSKLPVQNKGFVGGIKESWTNLKITKELEERRRLDELQFQKAGKGPLVKTYKYDPTKQIQSKDSNAIRAKNR